MEEEKKQVVLEPFVEVSGLSECIARASSSCVGSCHRCLSN